MAKSFTNRWRVRKSYSRLGGAAAMPNLIEMQKNSYAEFLQNDIAADKREDVGLQAVFKSMFPIKDFAGKAQLEFFKYEFDPPKYDVEECQQRGLTYAAPLKVTFRLIVWDVDEETEARSIHDIKEQVVYLGDVPLMTENATFVVNGIERVIVSQLCRSPGVFFDHDKGKTHVSGKYLFSARVIPYRGSWLDFEFGIQDVLSVRIDRRRKLLATTLLMALEKPGATPVADDPLQMVPGYTREELLNHFYRTVVFSRHKKGWSVDFRAEAWRGVKPVYDLIDANTGAVLVDAEKRITARMAKKILDEGTTAILIPAEQLVGKFLAQDLINEKTGEVLSEAGQELTAELLVTLEEAGHVELPTLDIDYHNVGPYLCQTLQQDRNVTRADALLDVYRVMRPGEPPTLESALDLFHSLFFDLDKYDLSAVGRVKMSARLGFETDDSIRVLRTEDIFKIVEVLLELKDGRGDVDDIDNLANRRVRSVGELLENQFRVGLTRMEKAIRERMSSVDIDAVMPHDLINSKPASAALREFFGSSQLSQFMDQTNPLSEVTHKRRLSALGPGGLTRDRAGFEVRDVHPTHYGRICPIETPEGPNVGLINSLATYARVNKYGFIESPYRRVVDLTVTDEIVYLSALDEWKYTTAQANTALNEKSQFVDQMIICRRAGEVLNLPASEVDFIDVSPQQMVSVAASLIPFLENNDANRALMGSNMQRQAVPLLEPEMPIVGTGMEKPVAHDSGAVIIARRDGVVDKVESARIVVHATDEKGETMSGVDIYNLRKFQRSNHSTCINQRPLVRVGDFVHKGDIIGDGPSTEEGQLALGKNVLVAYLSWRGYNFEDSIIISERIVRDDVFTSIHIEEYEVMARDTKLGPEEITRDIPNISDEASRHLDETGVVAIGSEVRPGDILVGKVTPKGESPVTPEEKLLRAIFAEKASDVRDTSLRMPPSGYGTVVDVRVFSRRGIEKDERALSIEYAEVQRLAKDRDAERTILERSLSQQLNMLLEGQVVASGTKNVASGTVMTQEMLEDLTLGQRRQIVVNDADVISKIDALIQEIDANIEAVKSRFENKVEKIRAGDEMMPGVLKTVKVFVAVKRKLQPGDKMAGRHGNKGVVSIVVPLEDMPHLEDGTPVDIILNPLGIPSRMNVGQILETHMGWAARGLGGQIGDMLARLHAGKTDLRALRTHLETEVYQDSQQRAVLEGINDEDLVEVASNLVRGVPVATPVFDGAKEADVTQALLRAGFDTSGQMTLIDGRTGEAFDRKVTVGMKYILKLHHLVDDKVHARSVGPYSLVTQQPLGGKAQLGGQRFGEMEVWALEAYGAAFTLQEMLTVKSDDVAGRTKVYESIVRNDNNFETGIPESFNVLIKELRSLGINVEFQNKISEKNELPGNSELLG